MLSHGRAFWKSDLAKIIQANVEIPTAARRNNRKGTLPMKYLLLIYETEKQYSENPEATAAIMNEYRVFTQSIRDNGSYQSGEALQPAATAKKVSVRDGQMLTTDGPFAETREQLGGYYLVDAADIDQAIKIAARIPSARFGTIEVRPVWTMTASA